MVFPWIPFPQELDEDLGDFVSIAVYRREASANGTYNLKYDRAAGDFPVNLLNVQSSSGVSLSAHIAKSNTAYQVPASRKFVGMARCGGSSSTAHNMDIRSSATVDTADGTIVYTQTDALNNVLFVTSQPFTILASQFLTLTETSSASGNAQIQQITGFETDA